MKIGVFHPGTQHSWQTALALQELGLLEWFVTSLFYDPQRWPYRLERLPGPLGRALARDFRRLAKPGLDPALVNTAGVIEWLQRLSNRARFFRLGIALDAWGNRTFVRHMRPFVLAEGERALWGYSGSSRTTFELARQRGITCILDRTAADSEQFNLVMAEIRENYPEWTIPSEQAVPAWRIENDQREMELANHILVGSDYSGSTIARNARDPAVPGKLRTLPYCYDADLFSNIGPPLPRPSAGPVRFLYVGQLRALKGIQYVLEAIAQLPRSQASLTLVGDLRIPPETFARYADRVDFVRSVPRTRIPEIMAAHDVLLFPALHEGAGIVLYEAQAAGLAIIQSDHAALVATEDSGLVLERPDTETLLAAMLACIDDPERVFSWRRRAQQLAGRFTFAAYRDLIAAFLSDAALIEPSARS